MRGTLESQCLKMDRRVDFNFCRIIFFFFETHILSPFFRFGFLSAWLKISINSALMVINSVGFILYPSTVVETVLKIQSSSAKIEINARAFSYVWDQKK